LKKNDRESQGNILVLDDFSLKDSKVGFEKGGVYRSLSNNKSYMIKEMIIDSTVNEFVASRLARLIMGDSAPLVNIVKDRDGKIYVASEFIDNFMDSHTFQKEYNIPDQCWPDGCIGWSNGQINTSNPSKVQKFDLTNFQLMGKELRELTIQFTGFSDHHKGNIGQRVLPENKIIAAIVDFSQLDNAPYPVRVHYDKILGSNKILDKLDPLIEALDKIVSIKTTDISKLLDSLFATLKKCYPNEHSFLSEKQEKMMNSFTVQKQTLIVEKKYLGVIRALKDGNQVDSSKWDDLVDILLKQREKISFEAMDALISFDQSDDFYKILGTHINKLYRLVTKENINYFIKAIEKAEISWDSASNDDERKDYSILFYAVDRKLPQSVVEIIAKGSDVNKVIQNSLPVIVAAENRDNDMVDLLVKNGADVRLAFDVAKSKDINLCGLNLTFFETHEYCVL